MKVLQPQLPTDLIVTSHLANVFKDEEDSSSMHIEGLATARVTAKHVSISDSLIIKTDLFNIDIDKFDIANCEIKHSNLSGGKFPDSNWRTIAIDGSRCSGLQVQNSVFKNVCFSNSKLDIVNFRFAELESVIFDECVLDDADFYEATLKNVKFINCTISKISFVAAKMRNVDLSESTIETVQGIASLKGATISYDQLMQLAPYFAVDAGITIV